MSGFLRYRNMNYPHLAYIITEGYCIFYALTVLFRMHSSLGTRNEVRELRNMIYAYFGMLISDIFSYMFEDGILVPPHWVAVMTNGFVLMSITLGCYFWFRYIENRLRLPLYEHKLAPWLLAIPLIFLLVGEFVSFFNGWLFTVDEDFSYENTEIFNYLGMAVNYFYLTIPTVASIYCAIRTKSKADRKEYLTYSLYMVAPLTAGLLEDYLPTVPILALNIFLIVHILFMMIQDMQIGNDALTNLNNRRYLNRYLEAELPKAVKSHPVFVFMIDINGFKGINDTYGHVIGDDALRSLADVLRAVGSRHHLFIARYGGDEFCLVAEGTDVKPDEILQDVEKTLLAKQTEGKPVLKEPLSVSIGYTRVDEAEWNPDDVIARADEVLYVHKKEWHQSH